MCRLSGYYIPQKTKARSLEAKINLTTLAVNQQSGGYDATGIGFIDNNQLVVYKQPIPADQFMNSPEVAEILNTYNPRMMIAHNRAMTLGDKKDNNNNHPNYTKSGLLTVHNGVISNHAELFTLHKLQRDGEVDSEIIVKLIEKYIATETTTILAVRKAIKEIRGSIAMAFISTQEPDTLYLIHRDNNLNIALDRESGVIYFATDKDALHDTLIKHERIMGFFERPINTNKIIIQEVPPGYGLKITKNKIVKFEVESPAPINIYQNWQQPRQDTICQKCNISWHDPKCKHTLDQVNAFLKARTQEKQMDAWDAGIRAGFNVNEPIKKPSRHTNQELEARLQKLQELEIPEPLPIKLEIEARRIEDTLSDRMLSRIDEKEIQPLLPILSRGGENYE